jgi:hypothetical protein
MTNVSPTAAPEREAEARQAAPLPEAAVPRSTWTAGRITALVIGSLLVLLALGLLGTGGTALWADRTQRESGYVTTDVHHFSTSGSALATVSSELGSAGWGWLYPPSVLGKVRIRVTPTNSDRAVFAGIGPSAAVDRYLAGVSHTVISEFWRGEVEQVAGGKPAIVPSAQSFWVASATGTGAQNLVWHPKKGSWKVVVMNADGRSGISVSADLGAKIPALPWIALGVLVAGVVFLAGGALLIAGALGRGGTPPS